MYLAPRAIMIAGIVLSSPAETAAQCELEETVEAAVDNFYYAQPSAGRHPWKGGRGRRSQPWAAKSLSRTPVYFLYAITKEIDRAVDE
jgi:hypothetical protein